MNDCVSTPAWGNLDNLPFYTSLKVEDLMELAKIAGLDTGCDVELLRPYWQSANSILEIGAGYGRVLEHLIKKGYNEKLTAVEICPEMLGHLKKNYSHRVELVGADLNLMDLGKQKFDLILWLWSGIADFIPDEQLQMIEKISHHIQPGGYFIIDIIPSNITPINMISKKESTYCHLKIRNHPEYKYTKIFRHDIEEYTKKSNLKNLSYINYFTIKNRSRQLYILYRPF